MIFFRLKEIYYAYVKKYHFNICEEDVVLLIKRSSKLKFQLEAYSCLVMKRDYDKNFIMAQLINIKFGMLLYVLRLCHTSVIRVHIIYVVNYFIERQFKSV